MFAILAALTSVVKPREGREALKYENSTRCEQGISSKKIYRESSIDKKARKELAATRYKERLQQQIKLVRLMKKLLLKIDQEAYNDDKDEELNQIREKVTQIELKVEKAARAKDINCEDMFNMNKSDDAYDIELEEIIRNSTLNISHREKSYPKTDEQMSNTKHEKFRQSCGDNTDIQTIHINKDNPYHDGDKSLIECMRVEELN